MNHRIDRLSQKLAFFKNCCIYESGLNGILVHNLKSELNTSMQVCGIVDHNLLVYDKLWSNNPYLNQKEFYLEFPAYVTRTIAFNIYKKTNFDFIVCTIVYQGKCYVCVLLTGLHCYESEFDLNEIQEIYDDQKLYQCYTTIIDFLTELVDKI